MQVVLINSGSKILAVFDKTLQDRALSTLERQQVKVMTNVKVCHPQMSVAFLPCPT